MNNSTKEQSNFSIALLIFIAVFGITNIPNNYAAIGSESITWFALLTFYFIPVGLIMAELASYNPETSAGISSWVKSGTNQKIAFFCGWAYFIENIFYLPMLASRIPVFLSWVFMPISSLQEVVDSNGKLPGIITADEHQMLFLGLAFITLILMILLSLSFEKIFEKMGKIIGIISLIIAFSFIGLAIASVFIAHNQIAYPLTVNNLKPTFKPSTITSLVWIIFAIGGIETIGSTVNQIDNPNKKLPKIVGIGAILVILAYVVGLIGISFILRPDQLSADMLENSIPVMFAQVGVMYGLDGTVGILMLKLVMLMQVLITISASVLWFVATINVLFVDTEEGIFPKKLVKISKNGKPMNAIMFSAVLILIFLLISSRTNTTNIYTTLYNMSTISMVIPFILLIVSYIGFKKRNLQGGYQFIKNRTLAITVGVILLIITTFAFIFGIFDLTLLNNGIKYDFLQWALVSGGGLIFFMAFGYGLYIRNDRFILSNIIYIILFLLSGIFFSAIFYLFILYFIWEIFSDFRKKSA